jgi:hypothetical protein
MGLHTFIGSECIACHGLLEPFDSYSGRPGRDRMVVRFIVTYAMHAYHHQSCEFELRSWRDVLDTTLCDKVCQ